MTDPTGTTPTEPAASSTAPARPRQLDRCTLADACAYPVCWSARPGHQPPAAGCDHWHGDGLPTAWRED